MLARGGAVAKKLRAVQEVDGTLSNCECVACIQMRMYGGP